MRRYLAAFLPAALLACADTTPADDADVPAPTADRPDVAAVPGNSWYFREDEQMVVFGPSEAEGIVTIGCKTSMMNSRGLIFTWYAPASTQATEPVRMEAGEEVARFNLIGVTNPLGGEPIWQGDLAPDGPQANFLARAESPITVIVGTEDERRFTLPPIPRLEQIVEVCR